jgi:hypothetical protein
MLHLSFFVFYAQLLPLSRTVYAPAATANTPPSNGAKVDANASPPLGAMAKEGDAKKNSEDVEVNLSASLNEWPDKHLPSSQDLQVCPSSVPS